MAYQSLYRKYRSQSFDDLIGQDHVVRTLQSAIERGRIAHAYLFTGPRGTGKTSTARLLAMALCAENGPTAHPSPDDPICREIASGSFVDVLEIDAASESGVDDVRETIVETVEYKPIVARYKVFIIDEVHDLSAKAFDALLKTIEEPPEHVVFILATTEYHKVPTTIRSRCQKYEFHRATMADLVGRLRYVAEQEGVQVEPEAVSAIARMADGGYRDALTLLEQAILTSGDDRVTLAQVYDQLGLVNEETVDAILMAMKDGDVPAIMSQLGEVARLGRDPSALLESMLHRLADLTRASYGVALGSDDATREASLRETAVRIGRETVVRLRGKIAELHDSIRDISLPRLWLESELIRLALPMAEPVRVEAGRVESPRPEATRPAPDRPAEKPAERPEFVRREIGAGRPAATPAEASRSLADLAAQIPDVLEPAEPETSASITVEAPAEEESGSLESAVAAWDAVREILGTQSKAMAVKLEGSAVVGREGKVVTVQMDRQMDLEWIQFGSKRAPAILDGFRRQLGDDQAEIEYVVRRKEVAEGGEAIEVPVEGSRLEQLLRDTFDDGSGEREG